MTRATTILALAVLFALSAPAQAGFVADSCDVVFEDEATHTHTVTFEYDVGGDPALAMLAIDEGSVTQTGPDPSLTCDGLMTGAAVMWMTVDVVNDSPVAWTGWMLELAQAGTATFSDAMGQEPSSSQFQTYAMSGDKKTVEYFAPLEVAVGDPLHLEFYVSVPFDGTGAFSFCLTQTPIPEPATMVMLALGGIVAMRRRRV